MALMSFALPNNSEQYPEIDEILQGDESGSIENKEYYLRLQDCKPLGDEDDVIKILFKLQPDLTRSWNKHVKKAIELINMQVPGLDLEWIETNNDEKNSDSESDSDSDEKACYNYTVIIRNNKKEKTAWTFDNIRSGFVPIIELGAQFGRETCKGQHKLVPFEATHSRYTCNECKQKQKKGSELWGCRTCNYDLCNICYKNNNNDCIGTAIHEILHSLGVQHEHQRKDRGKYGIQINEENNQDLQQGIKDYVGITPYDPHSIMHYETCEFKVDKNKWSTIHLQTSALNNIRTVRLSALDRIGLNILFPPCLRKKRYKLNGISYQKYDPKLSKETGLKYCNRRYVMKGQNCPAKDQTSICGRTKGPCCSACRVLLNDEMPIKNDKGSQVWLGWSNVFYCSGENNSKKSDGVCGPNQGPPCSSCKGLTLM